MTARRVGAAVTGLVLVTSAAYLLVYLYRWEWNRAFVSGLFFLAAEVALVGTGLLGRLRRIEERLDHLPQEPSGATAPIDALRQTASPPRPPFAWLDERSRTLGVFVPVLLGAGAILSLLAHAIERLSGATARPVLERRLAQRLELIALPAGGLSGPVDGTRAQPSSSWPIERLARRAFVVMAVLLGVLGGFQAIDQIADATQTRADPTRPGTTELTMSVQVKGRVAGVDETAEALWVACRNVLNRRVQAGRPVLLGDGVYRLEISPVIGDHARRRLVGCLEDATLDRVSANVLDLRDRPVATR